VRKSWNVYVWLATIDPLDVWAIVGAMPNPLDKGLPDGRKDKANASLSLAARLLALVSMMISVARCEGLTKTNDGVVTKGMLMSGCAAAGSVKIVNANATSITQTDNDLIPLPTTLAGYYPARVYTVMTYWPEIPAALHNIGGEN
jgi:hypothetical protein